MKIRRQVMIRNNQHYNLYEVLRNEGTALPEKPSITIVQCMGVKKDGAAIDSSTQVESKSIHTKYFVEITPKDETAASGMLMVDRQYGDISTYRTQEIQDDVYAVDLLVEIV